MSKIVWMDMEMTGLDVKKDRIMEVACLITDNQLNIVAEGPNVVVHQPDELLNSMDEWCTTTHKKVYMGILKGRERERFGQQKAKRCYSKGFR